MKKFTKQAMFEILEYLQDTLDKNNEVQIEVLNPDYGVDLYAGEKIKLDEEYIYHSYKAWSDLSELLYCKLLTPSIKSKYTVVLTFVKINKKESFHNTKINDMSEKYGENSIFFRINKNEEPAFLYYYKQSLLNAKIQEKKTILNLGINKADEFDLISKLLTKDELSQKQFIGIDFSKSAINYSKQRFPQENFKFYAHDINDLKSLNLKKADLIISIGTLQSTTLNFKELFMDIFQNHLEENGAIILGFPNCRWHDTQMIYGAKAANYSFSEQSVLYKDVYFCKKYLQQKKYRVTLTGKNYLFLTATSIKK